MILELDIVLMWVIFYQFLSFRTNYVDGLNIINNRTSSRNQNSKTYVMGLGLETDLNYYFQELNKLIYSGLRLQLAS